MRARCFTAPLFYRFDVAGYDDKNRHSANGQITLAPDSSAPIPLAFNTSTWPLGRYDAKLSLFLNQGDTTPIQTRNLRLGIVSDTVLPKAREGEFLFGLDAANTYIFDTQDTNGFAFYRLMGVDILRDMHRRNEDINADNGGAALQRLAREDMQAMLMFDPPKDADAASRANNLSGSLARLEAISRARRAREALFNGSHEGKVTEALIMAHAAGFPAKIVTPDGLKRGVSASMKAILLVGLNREDPTWVWSDGLEADLTKFTAGGGTILRDTQSVSPVPSVETGIQMRAYIAQGAGTAGSEDKMPLILERNAGNIEKLQKALSGLENRSSNRIVRRFGRFLTPRATCNMSAW